MGEVEAGTGSGDDPLIIAHRRADRADDAAAGRVVREEAGQAVLVFQDRDADIITGPGNGFGKFEPQIGADQLAVLARPSIPLDDLAGCDVLN